MWVFMVDDQKPDKKETFLINIQNHMKPVLKPYNTHIKNQIKTHKCPHQTSKYNPQYKPYTNAD